MDRSRRHLFTGRTTANTPFRPPWSAVEAVFVLCCTRCDDCVTVCPAHLLVRGSGGFPEADFSRAACTFCGECARICKTAALMRDEPIPPWDFGVSIESACLPQHGIDCRRCGEVCGTGAIRFRLRVGGGALPEIDASVCNGCGACIAPCPVGAIERVEKAEHPSSLIPTCVAE